ncbi:MAG: hypothetical protein J6M62_11800 [Selenomonadaceae bacterium]|nr:hypothetical protein [Selenomonadaceae bacterium]
MIYVRFTPSDYGRTVKARSAAESMAKFLCRTATKDMRYVKNFCSIMRNSYNWDIENYLANLEPFFELIYIRKAKDNDEKQYIQLVKNLYGTCKIDSDINIMRGFMMEYLIWQACQKNRSRNWSMNMGCTVTINDRLVHIELQNESKKTVDVAAWCQMGLCGFFIESKSHPKYFQNKDAKYLEALRTELTKYTDITYKICLFSLDANGLLEKYAEQEGYSIQDDTLILNENNLFSVNIFSLVS